MAAALPWRELPRIVTARFGADAGFVGAALEAWRGRRARRRRARRRGGGIDAWDARRRGRPQMTAIAGRVVTPTRGRARLGQISRRAHRRGRRRHRARSTAAGDGGWTIVPGFVDLHVHGGGGHSYTTGDPEAIARRRRLPPRPRDDDDAAQPRHGPRSTSSKPRARSDRRVPRRGGARRCAAASPASTPRGRSCRRRGAAPRTRRS